jgi:hypothetical protein
MTTWLRRLVLAICVAASGALAAPAPAAAEDMYWSVKSLYPYRIQVAFYSEWRDWEWPGAGKAFDLNDDEPRNFNLTCNPGEKICFGAWVTGDTAKFWGVGYNRGHSCKQCCWICGDRVPTQVLRE